MGRGQRSERALDSRIDSTPRSTSFIELYGQSVETSEIDCEIPGAKIQVNELPATPDDIKQLHQLAGLDDEYGDENSFEGTIEFPYDRDTSLELIVHQPSRRLALSTVLAAEKTLLTEGSFATEPQVKVLSYPSETVPAMLWAEVSAPEIGHFSVMASGDNLSRALGRMREILPAAEMPN